MSAAPTARPRANRHAQRKAATRQRLIEAARDLIVSQGYGSVDILDITERANLSKATFYKHFTNKEDCVRALMQQGFDALVEELLAVDPAQGDGPEWVEITLARFFGWAQQHRELLLIMVGGAASAQLNVFGRRYMVRVTERVLISKQPPLALHSAYSPAVQAQIITGLLIQMLGWWLEHDTGYSADAIARLIREVLQRGLGPQAPAAPDPA